MMVRLGTAPWGCRSTEQVSGKDSPALLQPLPDSFYRRVALTVAKCAMQCRVRLYVLPGLQVQ